MDMIAYKAYLEQRAEFELIELLEDVELDEECSPH